jgi:serine/threonine-protein kinase
VKVLDFGISKLALSAQPEQSGTCAETPTVLGSPPYMSPEQVRAADEVDARTDIWSLGCVLYELLTGVAPFERASVPEICTAVIQDHAPPPRSMQPSLAPGLEAVVMRCLQKDPARRFQDIAALADALVPFAPPHAAKFAERCRQLLDPNAAPVARPSVPPVLEPPSVSTEISALRNASRRSTLQFVAGGMALAAVCYVIARVLGASPMPITPAARPHSTPAVHTSASAPQAPSVAPLAAASAVEAIATAIPEPQSRLASDEAAPRKPSSKTRSTARQTHRPSDEPDVGF